MIIFRPNSRAEKENKNRKNKKRQENGLLKRRDVFNGDDKNWRGIALCLGY
jgi:hypothetical protein